MTLLTICQNAADEIGIDRPSFIVGNTETDAEKLYRYANKVGKRLMKIYGWQPLRASHTFTSINGYEQTGILPSDFDRIVPDTFWNRSTTINISGPLSDIDWESLIALDQNQANLSYFIYRGDQILIYPNPGPSQTLAFAYVKNTWAKSSGGTPQTAFEADTDLTYLDDELITDGIVYEYFVNNGLPFQAAKVTYDERFQTLIENDQPSTAVLQSADIFGRFSRHPGGGPGANQVWWSNV